MNQSDNITTPVGVQTPRAAPKRRGATVAADPTLPIPGVNTTMRRGYRVCRLTAQFLYAFVMRGRIFGLRNVPLTGGVLLVSNHQSFLDPVLATLAIPRECNYMARDTLFEPPLLRRIITWLNAFPVKRGTADMGAIKETLRRLKQGKVVLTFPEGTRTTDGRVGLMRAGVVLLARKARVPIVPTLVLGAFEAWPRTQKLPLPHPIIVAYDPPIYPDEHPDWSDDDCVAHVRDRIIALQERFSAHPLLAHGLTPPPHGTDRARAVSGTVENGSTGD